MDRCGWLWKKIPRPEQPFPRPQRTPTDRWRSCNVYGGGQVCFHMWLAKKRPSKDRYGVTGRRCGWLMERLRLRGPWSLLIRRDICPSNGWAFPMPRNFGDPWKPRFLTCQRAMTVSNVMGTTETALTRFYIQLFNWAGGAWRKWLGYVFRKKSSFFFSLDSIVWRRGVSSVVFLETCELDGVYFGDDLICLNRKVLVIDHFSWIRGCKFYQLVPQCTDSAWR